jgi:hypothetical protein
MSKWQRDKGINGELEVREIIQAETGVPMKRLLQCQKGTSGGDLVPDEDQILRNPPMSERSKHYKDFIEGLHIEVKRWEHPRIDLWVKAARAKQPHRTPCIIHRRNREELKVTIPLSEFFKLFGRAYGE